MEAVAIFVGIMGVLSYLTKFPSFEERKRILEGEIEYFSARMQDIKRDLGESSNNGVAQVGLGRKRKRDECQCMVEGEEFVVESRRVLRRVASGRGWRSLVMGVRMRWGVYKLNCDLKALDKVMSEALFKNELSDAPKLCNGYFIPVNDVVGQLACESLECLKQFLVDDKIARIAIDGIQGIGKTFLMKHLHNYACSLDCFDYVFWVSCPLKSNIKGVQDAVAAVVKCDFSDNDDDLFVRGAKLSNTFAKLGSFALFLDGVPKDGFPLEHAGIPVPADGSKSKLVLTTSSALECKLLDCFETVEIKRLPKEDAYELFLHKANLGRESVSSVYDIMCSLVDMCSGVPGLIENIATRMCGVDDPHEWRFALCELGNLRKKMKHPLESDNFLNL